MYRNYLKRVLDFVLALFGFIFISPVFILLTVLLVFTNRGVPFFLQSRPGWKEREFKVIKFKTMTDAVDAEGNLLPNHLRTTKLGKFLRKTSLDEIPQLLNIIKGDMSLVGPRPLLFKYIPLYSKEQRRRHLVRPGITGWAQINGRNTISWNQKFEYDVFYVDNLSFMFDMEITLKTIRKVISSEDVNASERVTMPPFDGSN